MRKAGRGDGAQIVVYDAHGLFSAARVWWTFRVMGFDDVVVLDGGLPAWREAGFPIEDGPPAMRTDRHLTARYRADLVRDLKDMRWAVETGRTLILDARPQARFSGDQPEPRPNLRAGHMPGAHSVPYTDLLDERGFLKSRAELEKIFADAGVGPRSRVVCTCGSGVTAAIIALAMARIGRWDAPVYDGGWAEWGALQDTPVATGAD
jgi:thiosulfate/3-mercaptopyruvate sulfurtransferase